MTDELNTHDASDSMDTIEDDLSETAVPDVDGVPQAAAFEAATAQAAKELMADPEAEKPSAEIDGLWDELDTPNTHVSLDNPILRRQKIDPTRQGLGALKVGIRELDLLLEARGLTELTEEQAKKLSKEDVRLINLSRSLSNIWQDVYFDNIDKEGNWAQNVLHNETKLGPGKVRPENMKDPVMAIRASFGQGSQVQVPLWNTGLWITFRAPTLQALLDFEQRTRLEKMNLGRSTNGMVFSSVEVYTVETYMRFCLEHVVSVNYKFETGDTVEELMTVIRSRDYQQVIWGVICALYPEGYPLRQPCVANPDKCNHIDEVLLNFARMGMVDRDKINDKQALMMASRKTKRDKDWLAEYQKEFTFFEKRLTLKAGLTAVLRVPTLAEQVTAGHVWVDGIAKATNEAFGARLTEMDRIRHIMRSGALTNLRQYSHWVAHFEYSIDPDSEPQVIDSYEAKDRILEVLSEDPEVSDKLNKDIIEWMKKSTVSYIALPKVKCPKCQGEPEDNSHPHLIPIDIGYVFFTLAALKINQVEGAAE